MAKWWIGVALAVGVLGTAGSAWAQGPLPEPVPYGPPGCPGPAPVGPLGPQQAPPGPNGNLGLPEDLPGAFTNCPPKAPEGCFFHLGAMALQRQRLDRGPSAFVDLANTTNLDTGDVPNVRQNVGTVQNFHDVEPNMAWGPRATLGYLWGNESLEVSGWYIFENDASVLTTVPGRLFLPFFNPPLGFEGDNGLWRQADVVRTSLHGSLTNGEISYRTWNSAVTGGEVILGLRYVGQEETLSIFTDDDGVTIKDVNGLADPARQATYSVRTHNNLAAGAAGAEFHYGVFPWMAISGLAKGAWGPNFVETDYRLKRGDDAVQLKQHRSDVFFAQAYEIGLFADVFLTDQVRFRAGYNAFWLVDMAEAVNQINFDLATQGQGDIKKSTIFYHGPMLEVQVIF